jgi:hypothetical protein
MDDGEVRECWLTVPLAMNPFRENTVNLTNLVGDDGPLSLFKIERRMDRILRHL